MFNQYALYACGAKCIAIQVKAPAGRFHTRSGSFPAEVLVNSARQNGDTTTFCLSLLEQGYNREGYVWICEQTGNVSIDEPDLNCPTTPDNEKHIYWEFRPPSTGEESLDVNASVFNWLEVFGVQLQESEIAGEFVMRLRTVRINDWSLTISKDQELDICRSKSTGVIRLSDGIEPVLFMLALKASLPEGAWRNALTLAYEDATEVSSDFTTDPDKLAKYFGYSNLESIRSTYEALQVLKPRFNLAKQIEGTTENDWF